MRYYLSLGSNLGSKRQNLLRALAALKKARVRVVDASSVYSTQPVGGEDQPWFYNLVVAVETGRPPAALFSLAKRVERDLGRPRDGLGGPRTIDIDILLAGNRVISTPELVIPHPRMAERNFVLIPLKEIAPRAVHPVLGMTIEDLLARSSDSSAVRRVGSRRWSARPSKKEAGKTSPHRGQRT